MATTYEAIATVTVGAGGASSISFTSISQSYTDLIIKFSTRTDGGGTAVAARLNSDSGSNYPWRMLEGSGVSAYSSSGTDTALRVGSSTGTPETASTFSNCEAYIPNYTSSNYKSASSDAVTETNATVAYISPRAAIWNNTNAITSIVLINTNGTNFVQYSTATLYGIKNS